MDIIDNIAKRLLKKATVIEKRKIADETYHLMLMGDDLKNLHYTPGGQLRILVGMNKHAAITNKVRTYSIWNYEADQGIVDLAVCTFSNGPGAGWIKEVKENDTVYFSGPKGKFVVDDSADYYFLIGDISSLAHLYEIRRNLSPGKRVHSFVHADTDWDFFTDVDGAHPLDFYETNGLNVPEFLIQRLHPILEEEQGMGIAYIGGEANTCLSLHEYFYKTVGWSTRQIKTKPFWHPYKTGLE